jgi:siroheme synthase
VKPVTPQADRVEVADAKTGHVLIVVQPASVEFKTSIRTVSTALAVEIPLIVRVKAGDPVLASHVVSEATMLAAAFEAGAPIREPTRAMAAMPTPEISF